VAERRKGGKAKTEAEEGLLSLKTEQAEQKQQFQGFIEAGYNG
jgi:hypothetical protein